MFVVNVNDKTLDFLNKNVDLPNFIIVEITQDFRRNCV